MQKATHFDMDASRLNRLGDERQCDVVASWHDECCSGLKHNVSETSQAPRLQCGLPVHLLYAPLVSPTSYTNHSTHAWMARGKELGLTTAGPGGEASASTDAHTRRLVSAPCNQNHSRASVPGDVRAGQQGSGIVAFTRPPVQQGPSHDTARRSLSADGHGTPGEASLVAPGTRPGGGGRAGLRLWSPGSIVGP